MGEGEGDEEHGGSGVEGRAGDVDSGADGFAEDVGEEAGADESGDAAEAVDGALELALFGGAGHVGEKALRGGPGEGHHVEERDAEPEDEAGFGEAEHGVADGSADEADGDGSALAEFCDDGFDEKCAVDDGADADGGEREADGAVGPVVAVVGVDDVDVHERLLGDVTEQEDGGDGDHAAVAAEKGEGADGIGAGPGEGAAVFFGEGFGQDEETVESVDEREAAGDPEGQARVDVAEQTTDGGAEDEADPEGCVQHAEGGGAALARSDVGHVGHGGGDAGGGEAGDDAAEEEPVECGGPGHEEVVEAEAEVGEQDDGAAAEAVGERADDGGEEELHGGEDGAEEAEHAVPRWRCRRGGSLR